MNAVRVIAGLAFVAAATAYFVWSEWPSTAEPRRATPAARIVDGPAPALPEAAPHEPVVRVAVTSPVPAVLDEPTLMATLRRVGPGDPKQAIHLAREGNYRFPTSPDAAERSWFVAKSLAGLGRFEEAQDETRLLMQRFPGSPWAADAERHLLVYPLGQPSREEQQEWEEEEGRAAP